MGTQFDPDIVEAFLRREDEILRISETLDEPVEPRAAAPESPQLQPEPALA